VAAEKTIADALEDLTEQDGYTLTPNYIAFGDLLQALRDYGGGDDYGIVSFVESLFDGEVFGIENVNTEKLIKELISEPLANVASASFDVALKTQGVVFNRLDIIRSTNTLTPPAAGSADELNRIWLGGFGSWAKQKDGNFVSGYKYNSGGVAAGYDRKVDALPGLVLGLSGAFSKGTLEANDSSSETNITTLGLGVYGSYTFDPGVFIDASLNYGLSKNESSVVTEDNGKKTANFDLNLWQFGVRIGTTFETGSAFITPSIGLRYLSYSQSAFEEDLINTKIPFGVKASKVNDSLLEIPLEIRFKTEIESGSTTVIPELRLGFTFVADKPDNVLHVGFTNVVNQNYYVDIHGVKALDNYFQGGLGVKVETSSLVDFFANYDLTAASKFTDHKISAGIGFEF
jgi:outer membrane autotransporter protein